MDLRDQLKNLFPEHKESDDALAEEKFEQTSPLVCKYEKKGRNGKPVTIVEGYEGDEQGLKEIASSIKSRLGIGGAVKDGTIIFQGDNREKIMAILQDQKFKTKRVGG